MKPRGDRPDDYEAIDFGMVMGAVTGHDHPFQLEGDEEEALAQEHREALARKRPAGFQAAWPEEPRASHLRIA